MTYTQKLQDIINLLTQTLADAQKFDNGVDAAGKRVRQASQEAKNKLQDYRQSIQTERNSRKTKVSD